MYSIIEHQLKSRKPIQVAVVGSGWHGGGVAREFLRIQGVDPRVLIDKVPEKAVAAYREMGIPDNNVAFIRNAEDYQHSRDTGKYIVSSDINILKKLDCLDVIYENTGDMLGGALSALIAIEKKIPFVTANFEMDATIGLRLADLARRAGVLYSCSDGDQPGVLARMIGEVTMWGFEPRIVGNCKGFLNIHQDPVNVRLFVPSHQTDHMVCAMADGTKQSMEMVVLGNAFGYYPLKRGMYGPTTTKKDLVRTFDDLVGLASLKGTHVDFVQGINGVDQGAGVFVIAYRTGAHIGEDMEFLKKGKGPFYLFFRDHHLCYLEAITSVVEAVCFGLPTFSPKGRYVDVMTLAKRDLKAGQKLDGLGGFDYYGQVERADTVAEKGFLPVGIAEFARTRRAIPKDVPITYDMVELPDNPVVRLRRELEMLPLP